MMIDFGIVVKYNRVRGFGFISSTFSNINKPVFFHISKVRRINHELAEKLDNEISTYEVKFWYEIEITAKGTQVTQIWLNSKNIPEKYIHDLKKVIQKVEIIWASIDSPPPSWLEFVTVDLLGVSRKDELKIKRKIAEQECQKALELERLRQIKAQLIRELRKNELRAERQEQIRITQEKEHIIKEQENQNNKNEIKKVCKQRGIENLIHFTKISNLKSILQNGLIGRAQLKEKNIQFDYNDELRLDNHQNSISLSISYPNYKMFYKYRKYRETEQFKWVILLLDPCILWELDCKFYRENAASNNSKSDAKRSDREKASALIEMFEDHKNIQRSQLEIPDSFPTDPQAEVLVLNDIPRKYIKCIHFYDRETLNSWRSQNNELEVQDIQFIVSHFFFNARKDYKFW